MTENFEEGARAVQQQINKIVQDTAREVGDEMEGQDPEAVYEVLVTRIRAALPGFQVHDDAMKTVAEEISAGTFEG